MVGKIPDGALGAPVHASISGTVTECGNDFIVIRMG
jgi:Na+-translocating ferredoxin:NAD+ oxidoreductase RnfC subunit